MKFVSKYVTDERSFQGFVGNTGQWCDQSSHGRSDMYKWSLSCWFCFIFPNAIHRHNARVSLYYKPHAEGAEENNGDSSDV